jgi:hypothetical protein
VAQVNSNSNIEKTNFFFQLLSYMDHIGQAQWLVTYSKDGIRFQALSRFVQWCHLAVWGGSLCPSLSYLLPLSSVH